MGKKTLYVVFIVLAVVSFIPVVERVAAQQAYPTKPIQVVVAGSPGGGLDIHARSIEQALTAEKMLDKPFTITHKAGGGGNITTSYMVDQKGNGYALAINSNRVLLNELMGTTEYGYKDLTPVARLTTEYTIWAVRADSKYKTALEVLADLAKEPTSVVFGAGGPIGNDHFNVMLPAKQKGIDYRKIKIVAFDSGGDVMAKLLGAHIPIISVNVSEISAQLEAGKIRVLAVSAPAKVDRLPNVPTWKDLGIDVAIYHWRGIYGPPDMPKIARDYWNKKFADMVKTKTWKELLGRFELFDAFLPGEEFTKQLEKENATYHELLGTMGMLKKGKK